MSASPEFRFIGTLKHAARRLPNLLVMAVLATVVAGLVGSTVVVLALVVHGKLNVIYLPLTVVATGWLGMVIAAPLTACLPLLALLLEKHTPWLRRLLPVGGCIAGALRISMENHPLTLPDNEIDATLLLASATAGLSAGFFCRWFLAPVPAQEPTRHEP